MFTVFAVAYAHSGVVAVSGGHIGSAIVTFALVAVLAAFAVFTGRARYACR